MTNKTEAKRGKPFVLDDKTKVLEALRCIRDGRSITEIGLSNHHLKELGKGLPKGKYSTGMGYVESVKDEGPRPEGVKGRRPNIIRLTPKGKSVLALMEGNARRKAAKEAEAAAAPVEATEQAA